MARCAHARYVWNPAVLAAGDADVQQQALTDFSKARNARFTSGFGEPTRRRKHVHEGFRVVGTDRVPEHNEDGSPKLNAKTGKQVMGRSVVVRLNRRWAARAPKGSEAKTAEYAKVAKLKAREAGRRKDWCEKPSSMLARARGPIWFEKLNITRVRQKARLNR